MAPASASWLVFVSSTWLDLTPERDRVRDVTLRLSGLRFIGMEHFGARDEDTRCTSLAEAQGADLYVAVIGGRWGSGITEQEYRHARSLGKPAFVYIKRLEADAPRDDDPDARERLARFVEGLRAAHTCVEFGTPDELAARLSADLHNWLFERHLASGLGRLSVDYLTRVQGFVAEYLGSADRAVPFGGRDAEMARLDAWLAAPAAPPYLLVTAGAGRGKSALLVRWTQSLLARPDVVPLFVPVSIRFRTNLASVFFASLTAYLGHLHGERLALSADAPPEVMRGRVADLLSRPLPDGRQLVLVLDGLDEAADWDAGPDLFPPHLGRHARVVVSARQFAGDVDERDWLRRLGWDAPQAAEALPLGGIDEAGVADVLIHMGFPLAALSQRDEMVRELHRLSEGDPLIVRLYIDDMGRRGDGVVALQVADLRAIAPGLKGFFARWWDDQRRLWGGDSPLRERRIQVLMDLLAGALGGLLRDDLLGLAPQGVEFNRWTLEEALEPLRRFVVGDGLEQGYVYSHPRLAIHFRDELTRVERQRLEERFLVWCEACCAAAQAPGATGEEITPYVLQHFGAHLDRAQAPPGRYEPLLGAAWRDGWRRLEGTYSAYRGDLLRVWHAVARAHRPGAPPVAVLVLMVRTAVSLASLSAVAHSTPVELIAHLVDKGIWGRQGALAYARTIADDLQRARALGRLAVGEAAGARAIVLRECLELLRTQVGSEAGDEAVAQEMPAIAPVLPTALLPQALVLATALEESGLQRRAVQPLLPLLPPPLMSGLLNHARRSGGATERERWLRFLLAARPDLVLESELLGELPSLDRGWLLLACADALDGEPREAALAAAHAAAGEGPATDAAEGALLVAWARRAGRGPAEARLQRLHRDAVHWPDTPAKACVLHDAAGLQAGPLQAAMLDQAGQTLKRLLVGLQAAPAIQAMAPRLDAAGAEACLDVALGERSPAARAACLAALVPRLPAAARGQALATLLALEDPMDRVDAALQVLDWLSPAACAALARATSHEAEASIDWQLPRLQALAPHLPDDSVADLLRSDGSAGRWMPGYGIAVWTALRDVIPPHLVREAACRVAEEVRLRDHDPRLLPGWAARCPPELLQGLVDQVEDRSVLTLLATACPPETAALALAKLQRIGDREAVQDFVAHVLGRLPGDRVRRELDRARSFVNADQRGELAMGWLLGRARTVRQQHEVVERLVDMPDGPRCAQAIVLWASDGGLDGLPESMLLRLLERVADIPDTADAAHGLDALRSVGDAAPHDFVERHFDRLFQASLRLSTDSVAYTVALSQRVAPERFVLAFATACGNLHEDVEDRSPRWPTGLHLLLVAHSHAGEVAQACHAALDAVLDGWSGDNLARWMGDLSWIQLSEDIGAREHLRLSRIRDLVPWLRGAWPLLKAGPVALRQRQLLEIRDRLLAEDSELTRRSETFSDNGARALADQGALHLALLAEVAEPVELRARVGETFEPLFGDEVVREAEALRYEPGWLRDSLVPALRLTTAEARERATERFVDVELRHVPTGGWTERLAIWVPAMSGVQFEQAVQHATTMLAHAALDSAEAGLVAAVFRRLTEEEAARLWQQVSALHPEAVGLSRYDRYRWCTSLPLAVYACVTAALDESLVVEFGYRMPFRADEVQSCDLVTAEAFLQGNAGCDALVLLYAGAAAWLRPVDERSRWQGLAQAAGRRLRDGRADVWSLSHSADALGSIDFDRRPGQAETPDTVSEHTTVPPDLWCLADTPHREGVLADLRHFLPDADTDGGEDALAQIVHAVLDVHDAWP